MCETCLQTPCDARCPNAPEPSVIKICSHCDEDIYVGNTYYDIDGEPWCEDCISGAYSIATDENGEW